MPGDSDSDEEEGADEDSWLPSDPEPGGDSWELAAAVFVATGSILLTSTNKAGLVCPYKVLVVAAVLVKSGIDSQPYPVRVGDAKYMNTWQNGWEDFVLVQRQSFLGPLGMEVVEDKGRFLTRNRCRKQGSFSRCRIGSWKRY
jgi:hypothetical protein